MNAERAKTGLALAALVGALALAAGAGVAQDEPAERVLGAAARSALALTVYQQDLALVSERRRVTLASGTNRLAFEDVPAALEAPSATLRGAGLRLVEQSFEGDLLTPRRLLEAAVGERVRVVERHPQTGEETVREARLLSVAEGPVLRIGERIETAAPGRIVFERLPAGLRPRPTLVATVEAARAGEAEVALDYLTGGLSWRADYLAELDPAAGRLALTGFVTLTNTTGTAFAGARLRLVAGEVQRAPRLRPMAERRATMAAGLVTDAPPAPRAASDRYLYAIARPLDLAARETKQVVLLRAEGVAAARTYRFEGLVNAQPGGAPGAEEIGPLQAAIVLELENTAQSGLGRPLPGGTVRVYETAPEGGRLLVGEDAIAHTAEGGRLELTLGRAFDVTGLARRTAFEALSNRAYETAQEITLANAKDEPVVVRLIGHLPPGWKMLSESAPHEVETAGRVAWTLTLPAKGEAILSYRLRVSR